MTPLATPPRTEQNDSSSLLPGKRPLTVRILYLEEKSPQSAAVKQLLGSSKDPITSIHCVANRLEFISALQRESWDVILLDYLAARAWADEEPLSFSGSLPPQTPGIVILHDESGQAVTESLKAFPKDHVIVHELKNLIPAIKEVFQNAGPQQSARKSAELFAAVFRHAPLGIVLSDLQGRVLESNERFQQMLGYSKEEFHLKSFGDFTHPDDLATEWSQIERVLGGEADHYEVEKRFFRKDGRMIWVRLIGSALRDDNGKPSSEIVLIEDITERKQADERIAHIARFPEENPHPVLRVSTEGRLLYANSSSQPVINAWNCTEGEEIPPGWKALVQQALRSNESVLQDATYGSATFAFHIVPIASGPYVNLYGRDITKRKRAEEALAEAKEQLEAHMETSPLAVIEWGADMRLIRWSSQAERLFGWKAEEVLGKRIEDFRWVYDEDKKQVADVRDDLKTRADPQRFSLNRNFCKDGSVVWCEWYNSSLRDESGRLRSILSLVLDVTERKRAEEALRERTEQLQTLLDTTPIPVFIAHDPECRQITGNWAAQALVQLPPNRNISKSAPERERPTTWQEMRNGIPIPLEELPLQQAARGKEIRGFEMDLAFGDGTARSVVGNASPVMDKDGNPAGGIAILMDVTDRKKAEDALKASELNMRLMVNHASDAMMVVASNGVIEAVSALGMRILGYEEKDMIGRSVAEFAETFSRLDAILTLDNLRRRAPEPLTSTVRVRTKNGEQVWLSVTASFVSPGTDLEKYFVKFQRVDLSLERNAPQKEEPHRKGEALPRP